jgi:hypothetical protein
VVAVATTPLGDQVCIRGKTTHKSKGFPFSSSLKMALGAVPSWEVSVRLPFNNEGGKFVAMRFIPQEGNASGQWGPNKQR